MFGLTKQEKLKKLLIKNTTLSNKLYKEYTASLEGTTEIGKLITSQAKLDLDNVAFLYDELKQGYTELSTISQQSDNWKLNKPQMSKGTVLTSAIEIDAKKIYINFFHFNKYIERHTVYQQQRLTASVLVQEALKLKLRKSLHHSAVKLFDAPHIDISKLISHYLLYSSLTTNNRNTVFLSLYNSPCYDSELLAKVASLTNTNIVLKV